LPCLAKGQAKLVFSKKTIDLGMIAKKNNSTVVINFIFSNNGNSLLVIYKVKASCGCTTADWSKKPIQLGEKGIVKVNFDTKNQNGFFSKSLFVESNSDESVVLLKIKGKLE